MRARADARSLAGTDGGTNSSTFGDGQDDGTWTAGLVYGVCISKVRRESARKLQTCKLSNSSDIDRSGEVNAQIEMIWCDLP